MASEYTSPASTAVFVTPCNVALRRDNPRQTNERRTPEILFDILDVDVRHDPYRRGRELQMWVVAKDGFIGACQARSNNPIIWAPLS